MFQFHHQTCRKDPLHFEAHRSTSPPKFLLRKTNFLKNYLRYNRPMNLKSREGITEVWSLLKTIILSAPIPWLPRNHIIEHQHASKWHSCYDAQTQTRPWHINTDNNLRKWHNWIIVGVPCRTPTPDTPSISLDATKHSCDAALAIDLKRKRITLLTTYLEDPQQVAKQTKVLKQHL